MFQIREVFIKKNGRLLQGGWGWGLTHSTKNWIKNRCFQTTPNGLKHENNNNKIQLWPSPPPPPYHLTSKSKHIFVDMNFSSNVKNSCKTLVKIACIIKKMFQNIQNLKKKKKCFFFNFLNNLQQNPSMENSSLIYLDMSSSASSYSKIQKCSCK